MEFISKKLILLSFLISLFSYCFGNQVIESEALTSDILSSAADAGEDISYSFQLKNIHSSVQTYTIRVDRLNELASKITLSDSLINIQPNEIFEGKLIVTISDRIPLGGYETCLLIVKNKNDQLENRLEFISVRSKPHPFLLVTDEIIEEAKNKAKSTEWAKRNIIELESFAKEYEIPERKIVLKARNTREWK